MKTEKHCSKIIFKCVNSTVKPIFNEKDAEKWNLWVREQCMRPTCGWKWVEKSNFSAIKKKKKGRNANVWEAQNALPKRTLSFGILLFMTNMALPSETRFPWELRLCIALIQIKQFRPEFYGLVKFKLTIAIKPKCLID